MTIAEQFKKRLTGAKLFKWEPNTDIFLALGSLLVMLACYYGYMNIYRYNVITSALIFILFANIILAVIFPIWWVVVHKKGSLSDLGITKNLLGISLAISIIFAVVRGISLPDLITGINWVPHLIMSALIFWEPFFVFGWLQTRYEKSFGIVPAIFLAAGSFAYYQVGSVALDQLIGLFFFYILLGSAFGLTRNIFTLWPIYWCIGSSVNSLSVGVKLGWDAVVAYAFAILVQIGYIFYINKSQKDRKK